MALALKAAIERFPVAGSFNISRGAKTFVDVVVATLTDSAAGLEGKGEATAIYYHGESAESVKAQLEAVADKVTNREAAQSLLPRGAARNALDAAFWDLEAKRSGKTAWELAGFPSAPSPVTTAFTISLNDPEKMKADASAAASKYPLLKLKLAGEGDIERVAAVRAGAPHARLIVDANEAWTGRDVAKEAAALLPYGVELIEQPVKAGEDHLLDGVVSPIPLCADESCQDRKDLARCIGRYQAVNLKLDKAGGLTEGLALIDEARKAGLEVMVGCMLSTSLGVAPAFYAATYGAGAKWVDLDGPLLLAKDRDTPIKFEGGTMHAPSSALWG